MPPWDWRRGYRLPTEADRPEPSTGCEIEGNISLRSGAGQEKMAAYRWTLFNGAEEKLRALAAECAGDSQPLRFRAVEGEPADRLLHLSRARDVDLMILGPHGHGAVLQATLGSVSLRLLREAACDVLIVLPPAQAC